LARRGGGGVKTNRVPISFRIQIRGGKKEIDGQKREGQEFLKEKMKITKRVIYGLPDRVKLKLWGGWVAESPNRPQTGPMAS